PTVRGDTATPPRSWSMRDRCVARGRADRSTWGEARQQARALNGRTHREITMLVSNSAPALRASAVSARPSSGPHTRLTPLSLALATALSLAALPATAAEVCLTDATAPALADGDRSLACGRGAMAMGEAATAVGAGSKAFGDKVSAFGAGRTAAGAAATALGADSRAVNVNATAGGSGSGAGGINASAVGAGSSATAYAASAFGPHSQASGFYSAALGAGSTAIGINGTAVGY